MRMILTGPPGGGKGTQAELIQKFFKGTTHLSTGELLRQQVKEGTELGKQAQVYMQKGELVPDSIILAMVDQKLAQEESFILDGFPRSKAQADHLDQTLARLGKPLTAVANLQVDDEIVVKRLKERGRQDDTEEIIRNRLKVYHEQTEPVIGHYQAQGLLEQVEAEGKVAQVGYNMITQLNSRLRPQGC
ncbi:MAG: adenylate kinase [Vulcanimicrobiota bacterium]